MSKFKVGDMVKIISCSSGINKNIGDIVEVARVRERGYENIVIKAPEGWKSASVYSEDELDLVEVVPITNNKEALIRESVRQAIFALKSGNPALATEYIDVINKLNALGE